MELNFWQRQESLCPQQLQIEFFLEEDSQCVGFIDRRTPEPLAFFGYWQGNQRSLLSMQQWMKSQKIKKIIGPIDFSTYGSYRLRLNYFDSPAFLNDPQNGVEQVQQLEQLGYKVEHRYVSYVFNDLIPIRKWAKHQGFDQIPKDNLISFTQITEAQWMY